MTLEESHYGPRFATRACYWTWAERYSARPTVCKPITASPSRRPIRSMAPRRRSRAFDAQFATSLYSNKTNQQYNNLRIGTNGLLIQNYDEWDMSITKRSVDRRPVHDPQYGRLHPRYQRRGHFPGWGFRYQCPRRNPPTAAARSGCRVQPHCRPRSETGQLQRRAYCPHSHRHQRGRF